MSDDVRHLPTPKPVLEPWITRTELADHMHVSVDTIDKLVREGMPSVTWGKRTRRFQASVATAWAAQQERHAA